MSQRTMADEALAARLPTTLPEALRVAAREHGHVRLVFHGSASVAEATVAEIHRRACAVAAGLGAMGVGRGEVVAVQLPHRVEEAVAHVAVLLRGAVLMPLDLSWSAAEVRRVLRSSRAAMLITSAWRSHDVLRVRHARDGLPHLRHVVAVTGTWPTAGVPADGLEWETLERFRPLPPETMSRAGDAALLIHTPTSRGGRSRGVLHTHASLRAELALTGAVAAGVGRHVHLASPTSGDLAGTTALLRALVTGVRSVFLERWDSVTALRALHRHHVTSAALSRFHLAGLLDAAARSRDGLAGLAECRVLGGVTRAVVEEADRAGVAAYGGYGRAEHPTIALGSPRDALHLRSAGTGRLLPGNEVRIVDAAGEEVPAGREGHILSRGPALFQGYLERFAEPLTADGWFPTGDRGALDSDGRLRMTGVFQPEGAADAA
ncbi:class I adenylate-forming enzyme family protein [Streptomyces sp. NPDC057253]|uniref:class I adenylate-forming enzyme family protein n=1 Tax=Streptomyces sp. NPDC057253 TaxID=3346069 RepID=UPI003631B205